MQKFICSYITIKRAKTRKFYLSFYNGHAAVLFLARAGFIVVTTLHDCVLLLTTQWRLVAIGAIIVRY